MTNESDLRAEGCPDEGELLAYLDDELAEGRARAVDRHLERCERCRDRRDRLESRTQAVGQWIRRHDPPVPSMESPSPSAEPAQLRGRGVGRFRWAAAAAVVLLVAATGGPLLGWVIDRLQSTPAQPESVEAPNAGEPGGDLVTSFTYSEPELTLSFESADTRGALEVEAGTDSIATVVVPASEIGLSVLGGRIAVDNTTRADGVYRLVTSRSMREIRVLIPGQEPRLIIAPDPDEAPFRISLGSDGELSRSH